MALTRRILTACATIAIAGLAATCEDTPTRPSPPVTPPPTTPAPVGPIRLELRGPSSVAPGGTAQFNAVIHDSDGTSRDISNQATWHVTDPNTLTISTTGLATGRARGETFLEANSAGLVASKTVMVLPDGTFRVMGTVTDAGRPVEDVRVEVTSGTGRGQAFTTDLSGIYKLYGVSGNTLIRASKTGYRAVEQRLEMTAHSVVNISLPLGGTLPNVAGTYTLAVTAAAGCSMLPEEAKRRSYTATVTQDGGAVEFVLSGADFVVNTEGRGNRFRGRFEPGTLVFALEPHGFYYYYGVPSYNLIERLSSGYLTIVGTGSLTITSGRMSGRLEGWIHTYSQFPPSGSTAACGDSHQFVFSR
jgi:hypothetical protein